MAATRTGSGRARSSSAGSRATTGRAATRNATSAKKPNARSSAARSTKPRGVATGRGPGRRPPHRSLAVRLGRPPSEVWGVIIALGGLLDALGTYADLTGPFGRALRSLGGLAFGSGRIALPPALLAIGVVLVVGAEVGSRQKGEAEPVIGPTAAGAAMTAAGVAGLLHLAHGSPAWDGSTRSIERAGGYVGALVATPLHALLASWGTAVVLVFVAIAGVLVVTGTTIAAAAHTGTRWGAGWLRRLHGLVRAATSWITTFGDQSGLAGTDPSPAATDSGPTDSGPTDTMIVDGDRAGWFDEPPAKTPKVAEPREVKKPDVPMHVGGPTQQLEIDLGPAGDGGVWRLPPLSVLKRSKVTEVDRRPIEAAGRTLEQALHAHGVETRLIGMTVGPTVARYELELGPGVKVSKVTSLSKDIAYAMAAEDVRILAPIPGKSAIGVEVPNKERQLVSLGDILTSDEARRAVHPLEVAVGRDINGRGVMANLAEMPHILIAGATGAGKSSCINSIITSVLIRATPDQVRMILVDPKRVELGQYEGVPHLLTQVVTNPKRAANALAWVVTEMERRYDLLHEVGVRDITGYNAAFDRGELVAAPPLLSDDPVTEYHRLPFILVVVDELNDLMMVAARDVEESICRIAQMARAVGIHLVIATQRPSVDVITGVIKANVPSRLAFKVSSQTDSRVILDQYGAEKLVGKGDMLLSAANSSLARRIQGCWVSEEEARKVVAHWRRQAEPVYIEGVEGDGEDSTGSPFGTGGGSSHSEDDDDLLAEAMDLIVRSQLGSTSMLQRKLRVGFARAGRLMDLLERKGIVGPSEGSKARAVLMTVDELEALQAKR
ncbi:MAG: DNA translocase FtsK [Acidimicrobiales bacterium]